MDEAEEDDKDDDDDDEEESSCATLILHWRTSEVVVVVVVMARRSCCPFRVSSQQEALSTVDRLACRYSSMCMSSCSGNRSLCDCDRTHSEMGDCCELW